MSPSTRQALQNGPDIAHPGLLPGSRNRDARFGQSRSTGAADGPIRLRDDDVLSVRVCDVGQARLQVGQGGAGVVERVERHADEVDGGGRERALDVDPVEEPRDAGPVPPVGDVDHDLG